MSIEAEDVFTRPVYAGNAISTVRSKDDIKVFTVRASTWEPAQPGSEEAKIDSQEAKDVGESKFYFPRSPSPEWSRVILIIEVNRASRMDQ